MRIFLGVMLLALAACSNGGSSGSNQASSLDPNSGSFFNVTNVPGGTNVNLMKIEGVDKFIGYNIFIPSSQTSLVYRKSTGTFTKNASNIYNIKYTYSTCGSSNDQESLDITGDAADILSVKQLGGSTAILMRNWAKYVITGLDENKLSTMTEDTGCNIMSKNSAQKRAVASDKKSTYFAEIFKGK